MKTAVYQYPFEIVPEFKLLMLCPAEILHVEMQGKIPCMWVMVWPEGQATITRRFRIYGTGHEWTEVDNLAHRGSFQEHIAGPDKVPVTMVWHLFEVEPWGAIKQFTPTKETAA
jgi:hypothetical protein